MTLVISLHSLYVVFTQTQLIQSHSPKSFNRLMSETTHQTFVIWISACAHSVCFWKGRLWTTLGWLLDGITLRFLRSHPVAVLCYNRSSIMLESLKKLRFKSDHCHALPNSSWRSALKEELLENEKVSWPEKHFLTFESQSRLKQTLRAIQNLDYPTLKFKCRVSMFCST